MSELDRKKLVTPPLVDIFHKDTKIVGNLNKKILKVMNQMFNTTKCPAMCLAE